MRIKKSILLLLVCIAFTSKAADTCLFKLDILSKKIDLTYGIIKDFREAINFEADRVGSEQEKSFKEIYQKTFSRLQAIGCNIDLDSLDLDFFTQSDSMGIAQFNNRLSDSSFTNFYRYISLIDTSDNPYEKRLFTVKLGKYSCATMGLAFEINSYNDAIKSVSRRMGRLIQSAALERPDYVTPASLTRLDLAMAELKIAEYHLREAIKNDQNATSCNCKPAEPVKTQEVEDARGYLIAITDLNNSLGLGYLHNFNNGLDLGMDVLFVPVHEGDIVFHPKIGMQINHLHLALGGWITAVLNEMEFTANVYYSFNRSLLGVGFNQNRIMVSFGYHF
jgi:hypothetical protein